MSKRQKLVERLKQRPKDFTWDELSTVLKQLGYQETKAGKTGGSRRKARTRESNKGIKSTEKAVRVMPIRVVAEE